MINAVPYAVSLLRLRLTLMMPQQGPSALRLRPFRVAA
ncbi:hypothetical protein CBM2633_B60175 [Cupriavidus taiwanensis]|nr:hypothetical protein CBM2633_B60175 [Cupriavidus taiwanensis]